MPSGSQIDDFVAFVQPKLNLNSPESLADSLGSESNPQARSGSDSSRGGLARSAYETHTELAKPEWTDFRLRPEHVVRTGARHALGGRRVGAGAIDLRTLVFYSGHGCRRCEVYGGNRDTHRAWELARCISFNGYLGRNRVSLPNLSPQPATGDVG